jgi:hypothetical protein
MEIPRLPKSHRIAPGHYPQHQNQNRIFGSIHHKVPGNRRAKKTMKQVISDIWQALVFVWNGAKKDPKRWATEPPKGWNCPTPEAEVKERKHKPERANPDEYTPEEILEMTEIEYRNKIGLAGIMTWQQARKQAEKEVKKKQKANAKHIEIEF